MFMAVEQRLVERAGSRYWERGVWVIMICGSTNSRYLGFHRLKIITCILNGVASNQQGGTLDYPMIGQNTHPTLVQTNKSYTRTQTPKLQ